MHTSTVLVLAGSVRSNRRSPIVASWVASLGSALDVARFEIVDLHSLGLMMDDEPGLPAKGDYRLDTTRAWSRKVSAANGFVIVSPQYNWGYPAPLKNALDHLHGEWRSKPAMIVTYGAHGGDRCAAQLKEVLTGLRCDLVPTMPGLVLTRAQIEADDGALDPGADFGADAPLVRSALTDLLARCAAKTG